MNHLGRTTALAAGMLWLLAACGTPAAPTGTAVVSGAAAGVPTFVPEAPATPTATPAALPMVAGRRVDSQPQTSDGGNVVVTVTPEALGAGAPLSFEIAMNTHSVDLAGDMLALVELRDERGNVRKPSAWEGPAGGGHHRSGIIRFDALPPGARSVTLVVKNIAGIRERIFTWELAS